ncbi:Uncharacterised protein [Achromobacter denitrificans]|uniref:hypothetical protein n=1 Tax=Achromobacter denitrificans TaxID=32002 RepID=UPI000788DE88|nr:hypothetical protein [Achromobacter denitrificans]OLU09071.1 hypothetical protein BVK87_06640 [Achromobacter denitrificans]QKH42442.1 hypothetical protein FOC82_13545 [Achromobacter denitrificans]QKH50414.1 hypothetical protein FOC80_13605 [Achromobacter denitrificans]CAB3663237.1 hypothetical protein LMG1231_00662 [Achromobacter denitrificans]SUU20672.1 Uncharacterised protein [Achromobacter denitrificans]
MQAPPQLSITPPQPGVVVFPALNDALQTIATDFSGDTDPAALAWPLSTWADTANNLIKRRNAAHTGWVTEGALLRSHIPSFPLAELPTQDIGLIFVPEDGFYRWVSGAYVKSDLSFSVIATLKTQSAAILGVGQSWQDVSASRAAGTIYTNSTSKPILVSVRGIGSGSSISLSLQVDAVVMDRPGWPSTFSGGTVAGSMIVPPGSTYRVFTDGIVSIVWTEYR